MKHFGLALLLCTPPIAQAEIHTVRVDGVVTSVDNSDGLLPLGASAGDAFSITYVLDDSVSDTSPSVEQGTYYGAILSMTAETNGQAFSIIPGDWLAGYQASINDDSNFDGRDVWFVAASLSSSLPPPAQPRYVLNVTLRTPGPSATLLSDDSLVAVPNLPAATSASLALLATTYTADWSADQEDVLRARVTTLAAIADADFTPLADARNHP